MRVYLLLLAVAACGGPICITNAGTPVYGSTCEAISPLEDFALEQNLSGLGHPNMREWAIYVYSDGDNGGTSCGLKRIHMAMKPWWRAIIVHEVFHAREDCRDDAAAPRPEHPWWTERGLDAAIVRANAPAF